MWEAISNVLTSSNALKVMCWIVVLLLIVSILAKQGVLSFKVKGVSIGVNEKERDVLRRQAEHAHLYILGLLPKIVKDIDTSADDYATKYMLERVYDEVIEWIFLNHLSLDSDYIKAKQFALHALMNNITVRDTFKTKEFKKMLDEWTVELVSQLLDIRKLYS